MESEHERETERQREREAEKERIKHQKLEERAKQQEEELKSSNLSEKDREKLLREHEENVKKLTEAHHQEKNRNAEAVRAKLEARRKRRHDCERAQLEKHRILETDGEYKLTLQKQMEEEANKRQQALGAPSRASGKPALEGGDGTLPSSPTTEQDWVNMLMTSPLFQQINDLQELLENNPVSGTQGGRILGKWKLPEELLGVAVENITGIVQTRFPPIVMLAIIRYVKYSGVQR